MSHTLLVENPADSTVVGEVPDATPVEATAAVDAAASAFGRWSRTAPRERSEVLYRAFELMRRDADELTALIAAENGKSLADARGEVTYAAEFFRWFAEEAVRPGGDFGTAPAGGTRTIVTHRPVGVAALVTPWNFPAAMITRKVAPALAAGCTVVVKPAAETPLAALALGRLLTEAGAPDGVVTIVPTSQAAAVVGTWLDDPRVRKLSFTGSTAVGSRLLAQAASRVVNCSMELGGNAPFVVTQDTDLDAAVDAAMIAKFRNGGQACTAANRLYVHEDVVFDFTWRFGERVRALTVGPADAGAEIGPMISAKSVADIAALVDAAVDEGARISHRAEVPSTAGHFYPPTILSDVRPDASIVRQEIFGPVAPIIVWRTDDELIEQVNAVDHGLAAYVQCGDLQRALQLGERIEAGMVGINRGLVSDPAAPFGGVKSSGLGREGARAGLEEYLEPQYFSVDWSPATR